MTSKNDKFQDLLEWVETNQNDKLQQLLDWVEYGHVKQEHEDVRNQEIKDFIPVYNLINKILSLMDTANAETIHKTSKSMCKDLGIDNSKENEWRVGDRLKIVKRDRLYYIDSIKNDDVHLCNTYYNHEKEKFIKWPNDNYYLTISKNDKCFINIDAELRAKDAEISRLKNPWRTDLDGEQK